VPGKVDWLARGLPTAGTREGELRAGAFARDDVVTARLDEPIDEVRKRVEASPHDFALVVSRSGVVLGRLADGLSSGDGDVTAERVMELGPKTVRADTDAAELAERLHDHGQDYGIVTTPEGRLVGVVRRDDLAG
jgi:CBS domain-containing protein